MAVPMTSAMSVAMMANLGQRVEEVVEPPGQVDTIHGGQVQARHGAQLDSQALQQDGEEIAEQDDEEELELIGSASGDVRGIVAGVNCNTSVGAHDKTEDVEARTVRHRNHETRADELGEVEEPALGLFHRRLGLDGSVSVQCCLPS